MRYKIIGTTENLVLFGDIDVGEFFLLDYKGRKIPMVKISGSTALSLTNFHPNGRGSAKAFEYPLSSGEVIIQVDHVRIANYFYISDYCNFSELAIGEAFEYNCCLYVKSKLTTIDRVSGERVPHNVANTLLFSLGETASISPFANLDNRSVRPIPLVLEIYLEKEDGGDKLWKF